MESGNHPRQENIMTLSLYSGYRAWRRDVQAERAATAVHEGDGSPVHDAIVQLGVGLAGIARGGDTFRSGKR
jgi:hypothetical protein